MNRVGDSGLQQYAMEHVLENEINKFILTLLLKKKNDLLSLRTKMNFEKHTRFSEFS